MPYLPMKLSAMIITMTPKKNKTQVFTDENIVKTILKEVGYQGFEKILDPACGDGAFIKEIAKITKNPDNIFGFDIDETVLKNLNFNNVYKTKDSLLEKRITENSFDIVIGNPPYLGYNECHKQKLPFFKEIKKGKIKLNDIFKINFHSTLENRKKYSPKPNLFAFFIALGIYALKDNGILGFLIPKTLFSSSDLDTMRWYLAKNTLIKKIICFKDAIFNEKTSSIIIILQKKSLSQEHFVEFDQKKIPQNLLLKEYQNWNIFTDDNYEFIQKYREKTDDLSFYYEHKGDKKDFFFDKGMMIGKKIIIPQGSQGIEVFQKKYRIVWRYMNPSYFELKESNEIISHNYCLISSDNYEELLYLNAILNSSITLKVINILLKSNGEKDILLGIKIIKNYIRIPKDASIKQKIINIMKIKGFNQEIDDVISKILL